MSEREQPDQPQQYCGNCGAEVRPGNSFCVSCGANLTQGSEGSGQTNSESPGLGRFRALANLLQERFRKLAQRFSDRSLTSDRGTFFREAFSDLVRWFKNLSVVAKVVILGLGVLDSYCSTVKRSRVDP